MLLCTYSFNVGAGELAEKIISRYANISSYEDEGVVVRTRIGAAASSTTKIVFTTKYNENGDFSFSWKESIGRYFKSNGDLDQEFTDHMNSLKSSTEYYFKRNHKGGYVNYHGQRKVIEDFCLSYAGATGISYGAAALVPRYLLAKECYGYPHLILPEANSIGSIGGKDVVEITYHNGNTARLFFEKNNGLLEKYETKRHRNGKEVKTTISLVVKSVVFKPNKSLKNDADKAGAF